MVEERNEYLEMCETAFPDIGEIESGGYTSIKAIPNKWALRISSSGEKLQYAGIAQHAKPEPEYIRSGKDGKWFQVYRQDQLQEALVDKFGIRDLLNYFYSFVKTTETSAWTDSLEQLWLMFLMLEHFAKDWNCQKKKWI